MPLDSILISELSKELDNTVSGMKIDRVRQPEKDTVIFSLRGNGRSLSLLVCFGSGSARVCLTNTEFENPAQPPAFCMLLRKHLVGARIIKITQPDRERMLIFELSTFDELGEPSEKKIAVELLGRNANLILVDGDGHIIDAARRVDREMSQLRQIMPGLLYRMPPQPEEGKFSGLSPLIRREMEFRNLPQTIEAADALSKRPYMLLENGNPKDYSFIPILQYGPAIESIAYPGWSELLDSFYTERDRAKHLRGRAKSLIKLVRNAKGRTERKLALRIEEMSATQDREMDKRRGDLITANIWRMKTGLTEFITEDFYEDGTPLVSIPLDKRKSPQQNAAVYYKHYTKKKAAQEHLSVLIEENQTELAYLASVAEELDRVQSQADLEDIRRELESSGYLRAPRNTGKKKAKPSQPMSFRTDSGLEILVGRNNVQNDELTFKTARRTDYWFHVQKMHGAHVILCCHDAKPDEKAVYQASCLAAFYSEASQAGRVPVDVTQVRYVKKPRGARPGMVVYTDQKTIIAEPQKDFS